MNLRELRDGESPQERYFDIKTTFLGKFQEKYLQTAVATATAASEIAPQAHYFPYHDVILCWIHADYKSKLKFNLSENKGLFVIGGVGTGKTTTMEVLRALRWLPCRSISCKVLSGMASAEGLNFVEMFKEQRKVSGELRSNDWYFDDFGAEDRSVQHFGTMVRPMEEVITMRYEQYQRYGMFSHFTSNLKPEQIRELYGERVYSRLAGMCNVVVVNGVIDMRKGY
jgi:hypothetical protein